MKWSAIKKSNQMLNLGYNPGISVHNISQKPLMFCLKNIIFRYYWLRHYSVWSAHILAEIEPEVHIIHGSCINK